MTESMSTENTRAVAVAGHVDSLAALLDSREVTAGTCREVGILLAPEDDNGYGMTSDDVAALVSRARALRARALRAHPEAGSTLLDILSKDGENRISGAAVRQYGAAYRFVTDNVGAPARDADITGDALLLAAYRVVSKTGRNMGDRVAAIALALAATPTGTREARALTLLDTARMWWNRGGVTVAADVNRSTPDKQETPAPETPETETPVTGDGSVTGDTAPVPPSADVVVSTLQGVGTDIAGYSPAQLARVLDALDALYTGIGEHPAYQDAEIIRRKAEAKLAKQTA